MGLGGTLGIIGADAEVVEAEKRGVKLGIVGAPEDQSPEVIFQEFVELVSAFTPEEQITAWEAFLQRYPDTPYAAEIQEKMEELRR